MAGLNQMHTCMQCMLSISIVNGMHPGHVRWICGHLNNELRWNYPCVIQYCAFDWENYYDFKHSFKIDLIYFPILQFCITSVGEILRVAFSYDWTKEIATPSKKLSFAQLQSRLCEKTISAVSTNYNFKRPTQVFGSLISVIVLSMP